MEHHVPLEQRNHYGHLLSDGTDISRMTVDEITAKQRKLSPKFPTIADALERRAQLRETIARALLGLCAIFAVVAVSADEWVFAMGACVTCFVGFVITCFVAGNRQHVRSGNGGSNGAS